MVEGQRNGKFSLNGKLGYSCDRGFNVNSSTHNCGCVVDGGGAMAAIRVFFFFLLLLLKCILDFGTGRRESC